MKQFIFESFCMNGCTLLLIAIAYFVGCYFLYGKFLTKVFKIDPTRSTPAHTMKDGVDYTPASPYVLFGHHFASIAGSGPILGPIFAAELGWGPALLWIFIGCVFVGAMHDFAALFLSVRNQGKSISYVIEKLVGYSGRMFFSIFCWATLALVVAVFAIMTADIFVKTPSVATASLIFIAIAPIFGFFVNKGILSTPIASLIFVPLTFFSVYIGLTFPLDLTVVASYFGYTLSAEACSTIWLVVLGIYVFIASIVPVQWLLQPRDYLNSFLLYAMLIMGLLGIIFCSPDISQESFKGFAITTANGSTKYIFPTLFIVIACGACSGFHSLVASGTTSKQISNEKHIQPVGYGGMLVEGVLAVISLISVIYLSGVDFDKAISSPPIAFASGISHFCESLGLSSSLTGPFVSLVLAAFMMTSLDTATRLGRFIWQEIMCGKSEIEQEGSADVEIIDKKAKDFHFVWKIWLKLRSFFQNYIVASIAIVGAAGLLSFSGEAKALWPVFGAANQLLAALTLLGISLYLIKNKSHSYIALIPMMIMMVMSCWGLINILNGANTSKMLIVASSILLTLTAFLFILAIKALYNIFKKA